MSTCEYGAGSNDMPGHQDLINKMGLTLSERADLGLAWPGMEERRDSAELVSCREYQVTGL